VASFKFGPAASSWLRGYRLTDEQIANVEKAVDADLVLERLSRPVRMPSTAALLRKQAKQYAELARKAAGR
jgi:hypothetical protein